MDERKITRNYLARAVNTRFEVIDKWYNDDVEKIDADILTRICFVLKCESGDIIQCHSADVKGVDKRRV